MARVKVFVYPKKGVLDPQGKTVESALHTLGYKKATNVRIGKYIELDLPDGDNKAMIDEMCRKLLVNLVIEDYHFEVVA
ncbi:MAG: phosphoribosylformylglycinamidine synthase subunit PurS [Candidatus Margulisbacteria bacterium]|nr:phosphoribosylformylglycinamidine synthase subunit PurS [Candidatus Margulisiibacteriota bacterium]MBU1617381.1 phosphoribosylformylglycinamidine synthase subunit PurS [Candidatus Margulisiibacteriota bacterium]MBU1867448.1 phosphoribosylformylglycinamidine synthase subunit PurS [Candidatus Margulisiibacteriota bacterium]